MNKIRKIDSSSTPRQGLSPAGPATAGVDYDKKRGLVINHDSGDTTRVRPPFVVPDFRQYTQIFDDFYGDSVDARWNTQVGNDTLPPSATINVAQHGTVRLLTGNDAGANHASNGVQFEGRLSWKASNRNLVFEARVKMDAITNVAVFLGFTDQTAALEFPATLGGSDALTTNASDGVGVLFDTAADTDRWFAVGVANNVDAVKQDLGYAPVVDTYETFRIEVDENGTATFYRNNVQVGVPMKGAVTASVALVPVIAAFSRTTTSRNIDLDYVFVGQSRS